MGESDRLLRLFERDMLITIAALAALSWVAADGGLRTAAAVLAGGALAWFSYATVRAGVDARGRRSGRAWTLVKIFTRYAILAVAAYVILARLRLHPVGVIAGTSALVIAAVATAVRALRTRGSFGTGR